MNPALMGTAAGLGGGGVLGQIGDVLSMPRRGLMGLLGLPEHGSELLSKTFGMDEESPLTQALGMGAEMLFDPLTYAGGILGSLGGKLAGGLGAARAARGAGIGNEVAAAAAARRAALNATMEREVGLQGLATERATRAGEMQKFLDPVSMATDARRSYKTYNPKAADALERLGAGEYNAGGGFDVTSGLKKNLSHADIQGSPGAPPPFTKGYQTGRDRLGRAGTQGGAVPVPKMTPTDAELEVLKQEAQRIGPGNLQSIHNTEDPFSSTMDILNARSRAEPLPLMGDVLPRGGPVGRSYPKGLADLPIDQGFEASQSALLDALKRQSQFDEMTKFLGQLKMAGGLGALGGVGYGVGQKLFRQPGQRPAQRPDQLAGDFNG